MKIQSPWMGRIKGSAGNMTGCKVYDKNVMRAKAFEVSNPNTQAQQTQRSFFAELTELVSTFTEAQLRTLFPSKPKAMSRRNALSKQLAVSNSIVGTTKSIDFSDINTLGNAPSMDFGTTTAVLADGDITVTLDASVKANQLYAENDFIAAIVNDTKGEILLTTDCEDVATGVLTIEAPSTWLTTDTIHAIPFITESKNGAISTQGFGTLGVINRPARQGHNPRTGN